MFNVKKNMSLQSYLQSHFSLLKSLMGYKKAYQNYLSVAYKVKKHNYPITGILKNGEKKILRSKFDVFATAHKIKNSYVILDKNKISIELEDTGEKIILNTFNESGGGIYSAFLSNTWKLDKIKEKVVIDIGAFIGDSSISFAKHGAKKVIAIEPLPTNFEIAKKNINENNLNEKIELLFSACGGSSNEIKVDPTKESSPQASLKTSINGITIPMYSLQDLLEKYDIQSAVLKMNCEGCEYDTILNSSRDILRKFELIMIEYHYGYKNLKEKLESCGFRVSFTEPIFAVNKEAENTKMYIGRLYAEIVK